MKDITMKMERQICGTLLGHSVRLLWIGRLPLDESNLETELFFVSDEGYGEEKNETTSVWQ